MKHRFRRSGTPSCFALALAMAAAAAPAFAEDAPVDPQPAASWNATGELGFASARGNARSESLNLRLALGYETERWKHGWHAAALRAKGEVSGDFDGDGVAEKRYRVNANRYELGVSNAYKFDERNRLAGSARYENDDFSSFEYQGTMALSYARTLVDSERTQFNAEIGPGYRRAREVDTGVVESDAILRGLLDFSHQLTGNTRLVNRLLVEAGEGNTFAQNDLGVSVAMNESFALKVGLQARHNTTAAEGIRGTDTLTTVNLVYSFR